MKRCAFSECRPAYLDGRLAGCDERLLLPGRVAAAGAVALARWLAAVNLVQQLTVPSHEELVGELPPVGVHLAEAVGVELAHEGGEVVVLEVLWQQVAGELGRLPNHEAGAVRGPGDD